MYISLTPASPTTDLQLQYPDDFLAANCIDERTGQILFSDGGLIDIGEYWFEGVAIIQTTINLKQTAHLMIRSDIRGSYLSQVLKGRLELKTDSAKFKMDEGDIHSIYTDGISTALSVNGHCSLITIILTESFINKIAYRTAIQFNLKEQPDILSYQSVKSFTAIQDILRTNHLPYIKRLLLEAKTLELLTGLHQPAKPGPETGFALTDADKERLMEARKLVEANLRSPCSLIELSRKTGLNDFKLKKGFKILFGNTVFGYLAELRMNLAYKLLQQGRSVGEVAETVGYKNAHHFTAAFKKRFDILPSRLGKAIILLVTGVFWL
ncbi:helix-turn-helix transcriptional regulator [Mucilaginibacter celer]|uniref:Helix-turn-helix domain-containing protein n=1 Tax=Mucilaginibacter celer TaxID=2305508 RepID=A0A494VQB5_9SPHI|nr:AraC family transcriptional regulator [Mucilaginibacter celer]AYL96131.1 helix-turn-helix domain-containing protein [Mucilaginibacter celer]